MTNKLEKIDVYINEGKRLKACDNLRNLINIHPNDLNLYDKLANIYFESGFYDAAGKYWILIEPKNENVIKCVEIYKKSVNHSGTKILQDLKFRGDKNKLNEYAKTQIENLERDSLQRSNYIPSFFKVIDDYDNHKIFNQTLKDKLIEKTIIIILFSIPILIILGIVKLYEWIFN